jgi:hypothetical protein
VDTPVKHVQQMVSLGPAIGVPRMAGGSVSSVYYLWDTDLQDYTDWFFWGFLELMVINSRKEIIPSGLI